MYSHQLLPTHIGSPPGYIGASQPLTLADLFVGRPAETVSPGQAAFWQGDTLVDVFQVIEGCLRLFRVLPDGRRAITGFAFAGQVLGLTSHDRHGSTAEAVTPVKLRRLSRRAFHSTVDASPELRPQLLGLICHEMASAEEQSVMLGCKKAEERLASFLVATARRTGADLHFPIELELPMSRQDIADYIGLTIETVSRTFTKFKREGLISLEGHRTVRVRRMRNLVELAGDLDLDTTCDSHQIVAAQTH